MLILLMIAASAVFLAMNGPTVPTGSTLDQAANYADIVFASAFAFEMVVKVSARLALCHAVDTLPVWLLFPVVTLLFPVVTAAARAGWILYEIL